MSSEDWLWSLDVQVLTDDLKSDIIDEFEGAKINYAINILKNHIEHPKRPGYKRSDIVLKIKELEEEL